MYQLLFKGECTPGTDPAAARNNARTLFKASLDQVERMFSGKPVIIRNKLDQAQAEKYRLVLKKHGMLAYVEAMSTPGESGGAPKQPAAPAAEEPPPTRSPQARPSAGPEPEPGDRPRVAGEKVDGILAGSTLSLDPAGITLAKPRQAQPPPLRQLDDWTLAPAGSVLTRGSDAPPPKAPDVSHLSLSDNDAESKQD